MRVICVDDSLSEDGAPSGLVLWKEYFVKGTCHAKHLNTRLDDVPVLLADFEPEDAGVQSVHGVRRCKCFWLSRFRPIKEVDVSAIFKVELTETSDCELEDA